MRPRNYRDDHKSRASADHRRGSGLVLAILLLAVFVSVSIGFRWVVELNVQEFKTRRDRVRFETAEAYLMSYAASRIAPQVDTLLAQAVQGGNAEVDASNVASAIEADLAAFLSAPEQTAGFPQSPLTFESVSVAYSALLVSSTDPEMDPYRSASVLALTARPFTLQTPAQSIQHPYSYLDFVPEGHPLSGMIVRRYPFNVTFDAVRGGKSYRLTRRLSVYQVPLAQFARFSSAGMDVAQTNVELKEGGAFAFGNVTGSISGTTNRLWAAQAESLDGIEGAGTEAARAFNLSSVQLKNSKLGGRLVGETWTLAAPHFFTERQDGEKIAGSSRPVPESGQPTAKAYEAQSFCEVLYDPTRVTATDPAIGPVTLNVYSASGSLDTSVQGVMRGLGIGDEPGFSETMLDATGATVGTRSSTLSVSPVLSGGAVRSVASIDLIAFRSGNWTFRLAASGGDAASLYVDGVLVGTTSGNTAVSLSMSAGRHDVRTEHAGTSGEVAFWVTPPACQEAYLTQWGIKSGVSGLSDGTFASAFTGSASFSWHLIPPNVFSNTTGKENVVLTIHADQPWLLGSAGGDVVFYVEGVQADNARYYTSNDKLWATLLVEVTGDSFSADIQSRNSFTLLSPNPVAITGNFAAGSYNGFYVVSRGSDGVEADTLYVGFDQASVQSLNVTGVVAGVRATARSYFDQLETSGTIFKAQSAKSTETNPFFKTIVLIDDFFIDEQAL